MYMQSYHGFLVEINTSSSAKLKTYLVMFRYSSEGDGLDDAPTTKTVWNMKSDTLDINRRLNKHILKKPGYMVKTGKRDQHICILNHCLRSTLTYMSTS